MALLEYPVVDSCIFDDGLRKSRLTKLQSMQIQEVRYNLTFWSMFISRLHAIL